MSKTIRSFIAIELDEKIHAFLADIQGKLKASEANVKWVKAENIHLTLKFLGNVTLDNIEKIKAILDEIAIGYKPYILSLSEIGAFPKLDHPRVIWVGTKEGVEETKTLAGDLEEELSAIGFEKEKRPFKSHLTLGRIRSPKNKQELKEIVETINNEIQAASNEQRVSIEHLTLFQSTLTPQGSIYAPLHKSNLANI